MSKYLSALTDEISNTPTLPTARTAKSPSCTFCSDQGSPVPEINTAPEQADQAADTYYLWDITEPNGTTWRSCFAPPQTQEQVLAGYPPGTTATPAADQRLDEEDDGVLV